MSGVGRGESDRTASGPLHRPRSMQPVDPGPFWAYPEFHQQRHKLRGHALQPRRSPRLRSAALIKFDVESELPAAQRAEQADRPAAEDDQRPVSIRGDQTTPELGGSIGVKRGSDGVVNATRKFCAATASARE